MVTPAPARSLCAGILTRWLDTGEFPDRMLPHEHPANALIQEIVFGCLRWYGVLQWQISQLAPREPDTITMGFLLVGLYQLFHLDHVPPHAAVHETVEAAKRNLDPARCRFLNAVLRNAQRRKQNLEEALSQAPVAIRLSHPSILVQRWQKNYGHQATESLCNWNNTRPTVSLRLFSRSPEKAQALKERLPPHPANPDTFRLVPSGTVLEALPGFKEGACYLQDPATELAVDLLDPKPGMRVLDACAAPGGKTFACAERMQDQGEIIAMDRHADRLERLLENIKRMRFGIIQTQRGDATNPADLPRDKPFDRILLDVPCSNTGVLQRRPDARWRITPERIAGLVDVQTRLLEAAAPLLAPDGILVYSTCSLEPEENDLCVENWIQANPAFTRGETRTSFPPDSGMDGAFATSIKRKP